MAYSWFAKISFRIQWNYGSLSVPWLVIFVEICFFSLLLYSVFYVAKKQPVVNSEQSYRK